MSPCSPSDVSFPTPTTPSGPPIPGVGTPFALHFPNISPFPPNFPEDLQYLFSQFQFLVPPGAIKPSLHPNYSKDIFDAILSMLDQFFPFLMLYKFFLPVLNLIICIIEVLCALMNPFALIGAINRLFSQCIPAFLNLFPIFALVIMVISLLLLLLSLIEYILAQVVKLINDVLRNINALTKAFQDADANGVLAIALKLGSLLCVFQNLFVLLSIFTAIIDVIKEMLRLAFSIPPCQGSATSNQNNCCSPYTCPTIVQSDYTNTTGTLQYLPQVQLVNSIFPGFSQTLRVESWQLFDTSQTQAQAFTNIYDAFDIDTTPKPVFFPTDANYSATTNPNQAAYTINLRLFYNPASWGRTGTPRYIRFTNCIVLAVPTTNLVIYNNTNMTESNGVVSLASGLGYEDDGSTPLAGFASDGITPVVNQATLENFIHNAAVQTQSSNLDGYNDGYTFSGATYTFQPNIEVLLSKQLVTLGCAPSVALNKSFVNTALFGNVATQTTLLNNLVNSPSFPDTNGAVQCLTTAVTNLRNNLSAAGAATFQTATTVCLNNLQNDTNSALATLIGIGFNACQSTLSVSPSVQFTSSTITVTVNLNENNGISLTQNIPASTAGMIASQLTPYITFGEITGFVYDGYQTFTAQLSSSSPGSGQIMIAFDNQILCTNTISADPTVSPTHTLQTFAYEFVYAPGVVHGVPRRDAGDVSRDEVKEA